MSELLYLLILMIGLSTGFCLGLLPPMYKYYKLVRELKELKKRYNID